MTKPQALLVTFFVNLKQPVPLIMEGEPKRCEMAYQYINTCYWHFIISPFSPCYTPDNLLSVDHLLNSPSKSGM